MSEHAEAPKPGWDTKLHCVCGAGDFATRRELEAHLTLSDSDKADDRTPTGAERYFATRMDDPTYAAAYAAAKEAQQEPCRADRWNGHPRFDGPHPWHFFRYGDHDQYLGSCSGRP